MTPTRTPDPAPHAGPVLFEEGDFHALSEGLCRDRQYDDRRLLARRKLLALGKGALAPLAAAGVRLECRTSLHHPSPFNGGRVRRLWAYLSRAKADKTRLRRVLGRDLAKDLDSAYRNAYLCVAIEPEALEVSLRIHPDAWYDGQNLAKRTAADGVRPLLEILRELDGFRLRLHDWKGEWPCGGLPPERLEDFLSHWTPGEHALAVERRFPAPAGDRGPVLEADAAPHLTAELVRLAPLYRYGAWSAESDFLFA
ncbi:MAG: hypothetical protein QF903_11220 [Planctomycetota bacterium]|jgi:hypothetical protein|nr:hypothetical protein [Planctomycetota bacterium]MDP6762347.1 hypothetical protein [Planctomycetota bacterium]MDP6990036.1 hypothetical protein [Planctomycetota bacterium]